MPERENFQTTFVEKKAGPEFMRPAAILGKNKIPAGTSLCRDFVRFQRSFSPKSSRCFPKWAPSAAAYSSPWFCQSEKSLLRSSGAFKI